MKQNAKQNDKTGQEKSHGRFQLPFTVDAYLVKAEAMLKNKRISGPAREAVGEAMKALQFLKNDLPKLIEVNEAYDDAFDIDDDPRFTTKYCIQVPSDKLSKLQEMEVSADGPGKQLFDRGGGTVTCKFTKDDVDKLLRSKFKFILHFENIKIKKDQPTTDDSLVQAIRDYVSDRLSDFARLVIDLHEDTVGNKKVAGSLDFIFEHHDPCIEGWSSELQNFQLENNLVRLVPGEKQEKLNSADHNEKTTLEECMYKEVGVIMKGRGNESSKWSECRPILIKNLVGLKRPLVEGGAPQKITQGDIDNLKGKFIEVLLGEE